MENLGLRRYFYLIRLCCESGFGEKQRKCIMKESNRRMALSMQIGVRARSIYYKKFLKLFLPKFPIYIFQIAIRKDSYGGICQSFFWLCSLVRPKPWPSCWFVVPIQPNFLHTTIFNCSSLFSFMLSFFLQSSFM